jgi:hypothetical protein
MHVSPFLTYIILVDAIMAIKEAYIINRADWQGDPCLPSTTTWIGLQCNNDDPPRIISL